MGSGTPAADRPGRGLAVLLRRGLVAWMQAAGAVRSSSPPPSTSCPPAAVPEVVAPEMVTILTQMVMATTPRRTA